MHSRATDRRSASQMLGKLARSDPRPSVRVTRGAGSGQHVASVLQEGRENANIDAGLGFIWRISILTVENAVEEDVMKDQDFLNPQTDFNFLSLRDLLAARDHFHLHLI